MMETMIRRPGAFAALAIAALALAGCGSVGAPALAPDAAAPADGAHRAPGGASGRYVVVLKEGVAPADVARAHGVTPEIVYTSAIRGFAGPVSAAQARRLVGDPRVALVEPDRMVSLIEPQERLLAKPSRPGGGSTSPEAPYGVDRMDAEAAPTHVNVGIAVIDTGIDLTHPDLRVVGNVTFVSGTKNGNDDNGHGSHVAGTAAAIAGNGGVRGVAPGAPLYAVKVLDRNGSGWYSRVIAGVDWVKARAGTIRVANMSLGGPKYKPLDDAISAAVTAGVTFVVAAGNSADDAGLYSPSGGGSVICVSAIADSDGKPGGLGNDTAYGPDDTFASFSSFGSAVDLAAPGVGITSTYRGGRYATLSGTSMASPHVAGAAALYIAKTGITSPTSVRSGLLGEAKPQSGSFGFSGDMDGWAEPLVYAGYPAP
ncbi:MAG: S8 family serine peptidase [Armatimonadetes bacterium]|nr:S8 family serine peptidase [Armatimonadota bacterium]